MYAPPVARTARATSAARAGFAARWRQPRVRCIPSQPSQAGASQRHRPSRLTTTLRSRRPANRVARSAAAHTAWMRFIRGSRFTVQGASAFQCGDVSLDDVVDVLLAGIACSTVVLPVIGDVVGDHADAEERNLEQSRDLRGRRRLHLFGGGAEPVVKQLDAIDLAVPDLARSDHAVDDAPFAIQVSSAPRRRQQTRLALEAAHRARVRILAGAAVRAHQVERIPFLDVAAAPAGAIAGLER